MKVPCRYTGPHSLTLGSYGGPYFDADGNRLTSLVIGNGDTLMMEESEIRGETYLYDPAGVNQPLYLGPGRVVKAEDAGKSAEQLAALGVTYQYHAGRSDFVEIAPEQSVPTTSVAVASDEEQQ